MTANLMLTKEQNNLTIVDFHQSQRNLNTSPLTKGSPPQCQRYNLAFDNVHAVEFSRTKRTRDPAV